MGDELRRRHQPRMSTSATSATHRLQCSLAEAVREYSRPGTRVYLGNFGSQLFSVGQEMIRQSVRDQDLVIASGGLLMDQLIGAGTLRSATFGHCWSPVGPSPAYNFRRSAETAAGTPVLHEMSLGTLTAALTAGAWGLPFMPIASLTGTGYLDEDWSRGRIGTADSTFGSAHIVKAEVPDVAFVHVDLVDDQGNGVIRGPLGEVVVAAQAARAVVLVAEEITSTAAVREAGISIPGLLVSAVVHQPGAVAPDGALGRYDRDVESYQHYSHMAATVEDFARWLDQVRSVDSGQGLE
jgi:glutaconate CoA-transferase subunit A